MICPTPSTSASSAAVACEIASIEPNADDNPWAAVGPTCRIESATKVRQSGLLFASFKAARSLSTLAAGVPSFFVKNSDVTSFSAVKSKRSDSSVMIVDSRSATAAS